MTPVVVTVAYGLRFLLELALVVAAGVWAWNAADGWVRIAGVIAAPVGVILLWGLCLSPNAVVPLPSTAQFVIESALFLGIAGALAAVSFLPAGIGLAVIWAVDKGALLLLDPAGEWPSMG